MPRMLLLLAVTPRTLEKEKEEITPVGKILRGFTDLLILRKPSQ